MAKTIEVHKKIKGPLMEYEDWWNLVVDQDGSAKLVHSWSHVPVKGKSDSGEETISIQGFMDGDWPAEAKEKLRKALKDTGAKLQ